MDETGLFYRMQSNYSLATRQLEGSRRNKERLTIVICTNGSGSHKLPLWIIGKSKNPCCLKNINRNNIGCEYQANQKAWMTRTLFNEWLSWFDQQIEGLIILLFVDR